MSRRGILLSLIIAGVAGCGSGSGNGGGGYQNPTATHATGNPSATQAATATPTPVAGNSTPTQTRVVTATFLPGVPTPTPTETSTPTAGGASICGGEITSAPKVCSLGVSPNPVAGQDSITLGFGASDLEGDIDMLCIGIALAPETPVTQCVGITPPGSTVNGAESTHPRSLGNLAPGIYTVGLNLRDRAGNTSNTVTATLTVS